jgi:hypothetical protein
MKKFVLLVVLFLMSTMLFAGPFGLEMGMTLEEIREKCGSSNVKYSEDGVYMVKPPRKSSSFNGYIALVDDTFGLHATSANSVIMPYKQCIIHLRDLFNRLRAYYGEPQMRTLLKDINPVYMASESPDTVVQHTWKRPECKKLEKENVDSLTILIRELGEDAGYVSITYFFDNHKKVVGDATPF